MATQRTTTAFVIGLLLTTTIAALLALLPAHSIHWSAFAVAVAVPALLVAVLTLSVIGMVIGKPAKMPLFLQR